MPESSKLATVIAVACLSGGSGKTTTVQTRMSKAAITALLEALPNIHIFSSVRQSTVVQQTNHAGWSLLEAGEKSLAQPYIEVVDAIVRSK